VGNGLWIERWNLFDEEFGGRLKEGHMDRDLLLELWEDMWKEGNWVPSWPDTLNDVRAEQAAWKPADDPMCRSIWEETVHVTYWRRVTLERLSGGEPPTEEEIDRLEFAVPAIQNEEAWRKAVEMLRDTQHELAAVIKDPESDLTRIPYHLIHDAYHLGRITQIRKVQGASPKF
jgi:hypothetical protein